MLQLKKLLSNFTISVLSPSPSFALLSDKSSKLLRIPRRGKDFGFTLRHFIVYPPEVRS